MEEETIITVKSSELPIERFERFMDATTNQLRIEGRNNPEYFCKNNGEHLEPIVLDQMRSLACEFDFTPELIVKTPKQHFPDILSERFFGVEVKTTKSNSWRSTGSSIVESLRDKNVERIYMLFGKLSAKDIDFRCKPYEQCLYDINVTHSPRYEINMDMKASDKTIFEKIGLPYDEFRQSPDQIKIVKEFFRERCKRNGKGMPWWIDDTPTETVFMPEELQIGLSEVTLMSDLSANVESYLITAMFILFPEILGNSTTKFKGPAQWLCARHSIVSPCLRDSFSAGGKVNIISNTDVVYPKVPKILCNFIKHLKTIRKIFQLRSDVYDEISTYASYKGDKRTPYEAWKNAVKFFLSQIIDTSKLSVDEILKMEYVGEDTEGIVVRIGNTL